LLVSISTRQSSMQSGGRLTLRKQMKLDVGVLDVYLSLQVQVFEGAQFLPEARQRDKSVGKHPALEGGETDLIEVDAKA
jgi:hypothetical protein